jgi:cell wall-associated NlpC family hydrolase
MLRFKNVKFLILGTVIVGFGVLSSPVPSQAQSYTVKKGDTLWGIARSFQTTVSAIKELNNLTGDLIRPGKVLQIPAVSGQPQAGNNNETAAGASNHVDKYVVRQGDCLWLIAQKYGVQVAALKEANNLQSDLIYPGQVLIVPATRSGGGTDSVVSPSRGAASSVVDTARRFIGVPYVYGGSSPVKGFDCSGFVQYVFSLHGVKLPRTADAQARSGKRVETPAPGDLVCFSENNGYVSHVGIYIGNNSFIHANRGQGVTITSLSDNWYRTRYAGARRVL